MPRGKNYLNNNKGMFLQAGKYKPKMVECQYGSACNRKDCIYSHPGGTNDSGSSSSSSSLQQGICMNFLAGNCAFTRNCRKKHPSQDECEQLRQQYKQIPCKFGDECETEGCLYQHPWDAQHTNAAILKQGQERLLLEQQQQQQQNQLQFAATTSSSSSSSIAQHQMLQQQQMEHQRAMYGMPNMICPPAAAVADTAGPVFGEEDFPSLGGGGGGVESAKQKEDSNEGAPPSSWQPQQQEEEVLYPPSAVQPNAEYHYDPQQLQHQSLYDFQQQQQHAPLQYYDVNYAPQSLYAFQQQQQQQQQYYQEGPPQSTRDEPSASITTRLSSQQTSTSITSTPGQLSASAKEWTFGGS